jgi:hypothetical protein
VLDGVLGDQAGVVGGAAGDDDDLVDPCADLWSRCADLVEVSSPSLVEAAQQGVGDGRGCSKISLRMNQS